MSRRSCTTNSIHIAGVGKVQIPPARVFAIVDGHRKEIVLSRKGRNGRRVHPSQLDGLTEVTVELDGSTITGTLDPQAYRGRRGYTATGATDFDRITREQSAEAAATAARLVLGAHGNTAEQRSNARRALRVLGYDVPPGSDGTQVFEELGFSPDAARRLDLSAADPRTVADLVANGVPFTLIDELNATGVEPATLAALTNIPDVTADLVAQVTADGVPYQVIPDLVTAGLTNAPAMIDVTHWGPDITYTAPLVARSVPRDVIISCHAAGFAVADLCYAHDLGADIGALPAITNLTDVIDALRIGADPAQLPAFAALGFEPQAALEMLGEGIDTELAGRYVEAGFTTEHHHSHIVAAHRVGLTPDIAVDIAGYEPMGPAELLTAFDAQRAGREVPPEVFDAANRAVRTRIEGALEQAALLRVAMSDTFDHSSRRAERFHDELDAALTALTKRIESVHHEARSTVEHVRRRHR